MQKKNRTFFSPYEIIYKKRNGRPLDAEEIEFMIQGLVEGNIADYQMTALLMAIYFQDMNVAETHALTNCMLNSGKKMVFEDALAVDKHSTGGVGDKASFICGPLAHACGVHVPMIAGRGLGHTGGTVDKVESIPGFKTKIGLKKYRELFLQNGQVMIGQTKDLCPADRIIYGLRDVTATIDSIPLITASIMSKKLAEGANGLVMDIKTGQGAFMSKLADAKALAKSLRQTGLCFNKNMMTLITDMSQPLGMAVGNSLEIIESIETLKNNGPTDLTDISIELAGGMIHLAGLAKTHAAGNRLAKKALKDGSGLKSFTNLIGNQGGNTEVINNYDLLPQSKVITSIKAKSSGYITKMDTTGIGQYVVKLGGGRLKSGQRIDHSVGLILKKKLYQKVSKGDVLMDVYHHRDQQSMIESLEKDSISNLMTINKSLPKNKKPLIYEVKIEWSKNHV